MGLLSALNIGTRGLFSAQLGMDVAGQNISNADVEGYSKKRLNMTADYRYDSSFGQMGIGVEVVSIERMRNAFIDEQIRRQNQEVGYFDQMNYTFESIENVFTEPGETGVLQFMDQFFDSWQNLANNPADLSARTMVKTNAEILIDVFGNVSGELRNLGQTRNEELAQRINKVNQISEQLYNLNIEIGAVEVGEQKANDSRDRRDLLLKELSKLIDTNVIENEQGQITVTTSGNVIVSPVYFQKLETSTTSRVLPDGTSVTDIGVRFADSKRAFQPKGGEIKGLLDSRDIIIPEYQKRLDTLAIALVEKVNEIHMQGFNLFGYSGTQFFDSNITGASDIKLSASILSNVQNIAAASGGEANPAAQNAVIAGSHNFGTAPVQLYRDPLAPTPTSARNIVRGTAIVRTPSLVLQEGVDYHIDYAYGTIQMLHAGYDPVDLTVDFQYRTGGYQGPGDNATAISIAKIRSELTMNPDLVGNNTSTLTDYYSSMIGRLGLSRNQAQSNLETRTFLVDQYERHQDSISGVSLDEEMADLIKYQHTYQASARLISTVDKMLDVLLNI